MLRDTTAFQVWTVQTDPRVSIWLPVHGWIDGLNRETWQSPSAPIEELSVRPLYEVRLADLRDIDGPDVQIIYRHEYDADTTDLIWVGQLDP